MKRAAPRLDVSSLTDEDLERILAEQAPHDPLSPYFEFGAGHYRPSPGQLEFHKSWDYYSLVLGGGRTGKTTSCLADLAMCLRGIHPFKPWQGPFTALAFAVNRQQAAMVMGRKLLQACEIPADRGVLGPDGKPAYPEITAKPLIPEWEIADIGTLKHGFRTTYWVKLTNDCELWFSWSEVEDTWKRIQGPKIGYIYIDENAGNRKLMIEARKRLQDSQRPGSWLGRMVWGGHGTEDNDAFSEFRGMCEDRRPDHRLFKLLPGETGAVTAEATARFAAALTPEERRIHITAESDAGDLVRIFKQQWSDDMILREDRVVADDDNILIGYDPGVDHPMGMLGAVLGREAPTTLTAVKAWLRRGGTINDDVNQLAEWLDGRRVAAFVYDTNLKNKDRGGGPSVLAQMKELMALRGVVVTGWYQSKKNHAPGINLLRQMFARRQFRVNGSPESGCMQLVSQIKKYKGKEATRFTGDGGVVKKDDELMDALRYLAMAGLGWRREFACGEARSAAAARLDDDLPGDEATERLRRLSAEAAALRSRRGGGRMGRTGMAIVNGRRVSVPLWYR